jgi:hypothetical protein
VTAPLPPRRSGRILWATLAFVAGFAILLAFVSRWYLIPAMQAAQTAQGIEKRQLVAHSRLLLAIILFILVAGILLTFRFGTVFRAARGRTAEADPVHRRVGGVRETRVGSAS